MPQLPLDVPALKPEPVRVTGPGPPDLPEVAPLPAGGGGGEGRLMQLGAGGEVSFPPPNDVVIAPFVVVCTPTTRMSPAGIPSAFTVMDPLFEMVV